MTGGRIGRFAALALAVTLLVAGCSYLIEGDYTDVQEHQPEPTPGDDGEEYILVTGYAGLQSVVMDMVRERTESATLRIEGAGPEDEQEIRDELEEIGAQPLVAYAVSGLLPYIDTDSPGHVDVQLNITYSKTAEQIAGVVSVSTASTAADLLEEMLVSAETYLAMLCPSTIANYSLIEGTIKDYYYGQALDAVVLPGVLTSLYPSTGSASRRVAEVELDFGRDEDELVAMRGDLLTAVEDLTTGLPEGATGEQVIWLGEALNGWVSPDEAVRTEEEPDLTSPREVSYTAYGALVERSAVSEGYAMAFKALCDYLDIECYVVQGYWERSRHVWNIVRLDDGIYCHMDIALLDELGPEATFIASDTDMLEREYSWDTSKYERCEGQLTYWDLIPQETE